MDFEKRLSKLEARVEATAQKQTIKIIRLIGEWQGFLEGICLWDIPKELKEKLEARIELLKKTGV